MLFLNNILAAGVSLPHGPSHQTSLHFTVAVYCDPTGPFRRVLTVRLRTQVGPYRYSDFAPGLRAPSLVGHPIAKSTRTLPSTAGIDSVDPLSEIETPTQQSAGESIDGPADLDGGADRPNEPIMAWLHQRLVSTDETLVGPALLLTFEWLGIRRLPLDARPTR